MPHLLRLEHSLARISPMPKITFYERQIIESGLRRGKSVRSIARSLSRDHRVIQKEVNRNSISGRPYQADLAQRVTDKREEKRHRPKLEKPDNQYLRKFIVDHLKEDWSPEQIVGVLKEQPPKKLSEKTICVETIYQYIYEGDGRWEGLFRHLRRGRKKRQQRWGRKPQKVAIPQRISIHERPEEVAAKIDVGHWETDTLEGKRSCKAAVSVQYERKLQLARLSRILDKTASSTEEAIRKSIDSTPTHLWKTITYDNGKEGATHFNLCDDFDIQTFFCDAYCSWQKGGVENLNGLIRQYLPKGTDFSKLTEKQISAIQEKLNNRPRKSLNYLTPNQALAREVGH